MSLFENHDNNHSVFLKLVIVFSNQFNFQKIAQIVNKTVIITSRNFS